MPTPLTTASEVATAETATVSPAADLLAATEQLVNFTVPVEDLPTAGSGSVTLSRIGSLYAPFLAWITGLEAAVHDLSVMLQALLPSGQTLDHLTMTISSSSEVETATPPTLTLGQYQTSDTSAPYTDTLSPANAFSSSAPSVATIGATTGLITLHGPGATTFTRTAGGKTATVGLTVTAEVLTSTPSSLSVTVGAAPSAALIIKDQASVDVTSGCTFASSNTAVATVNTSGVVTYVAAGTCNIVATHTVDGETCTIGTTVTSVTPTVPAGIAFYDTYDADLTHSHMIFTVAAAADVGTHPIDSYNVYRDGALALSVAYSGASQQVDVPVATATAHVTNTWTVTSVKAGVESTTAASVSATQPQYGWSGLGIGTGTVKSDDFHTYDSITGGSVPLASDARYPSGNLNTTGLSIDTTKKWWDRTARAWRQCVLATAASTGMDIYDNYSGSPVADLSTRLVHAFTGSFGWGGDYSFVRQVGSDTNGATISIKLVYFNGDGTYGLSVSGTYLTTVSTDITTMVPNGELTDSSATDLIVRTTAIANGMRLRIYATAFGQAQQLVWDANYTNASYAAGGCSAIVTELLQGNSANTNSKRTLQWAVADMSTSPSSFAGLPTGSAVTYSRPPAAAPIMGAVDIGDWAGTQSVADAAFRAQVNSTATLYNSANTALAGAGSSTAPLTSSLIDLFSVSTTVLTPRGTNSLRQIIPDNKAQDVSGTLSYGFGIGVEPDAVWLEQEVRFDPATYTTKGDPTNPGNSSQAAAHKLLAIGIVAPIGSGFQYDGRCDFELTNGSGVAGTSAVAEYSTGDIPTDANNVISGSAQRIATITSGVEDGPLTGTAFTDGAWRRFVFFHGKIDSTHFSERLWVYKWNGSSWALETSNIVNYVLTGSYVLPLYYFAGIGGLNFNQLTGTQGIALNRGRTRIRSYAEYGKAVNPFGVPSGDINDLP